MRRLVTLLLTALMLISFCACESEQERARRIIDESIQAYQEQKEKVDNLQDQIDEYNRIIEGSGK